MTRMFERDPLTTATEVDDEIFLVRPNVEDIHHLDLIASGLWRFLDVARSLEEMQTVLGDAFPDVSAEVMRQDLETALESMLAAGFIRTQSVTRKDVDAEIG